MGCKLLWNVNVTFLVTNKWSLIMSEWWMSWIVYCCGSWWDLFSDQQVKFNYARVVDETGDVYCCARLMGPYSHQQVTLKKLCKGAGWDRFYTVVQNRPWSLRRPWQNLHLPPLHNRVARTLDAWELIFHFSAIFSFSVASLAPLRGWHNRQSPSSPNGRAGPAVVEGWWRLLS